MKPEHKTEERFTLEESYGNFFLCEKHPRRITAMMSRKEDAALILSRCNGYNNMEKM